MFCEWNENSEWTLYIKNLNVLNIMQHDQKIIQVSEKVLFFILFYLYNGLIKKSKIKSLLTLVLIHLKNLKISHSTTKCSCSLKELPLIFRLT